MEAKLTYFRERGKFYSEGTLPVRDDACLLEIWSQIERLRDQGDLPGLIHGAQDYHVLVTVPGHPHDHPRLIMLPPPARTQ
jgi:hypothetical protein